MTLFDFDIFEDLPTYRTHTLSRSRRKDEVPSCQPQKKWSIDNSQWWDTLTGGTTYSLFTTLYPTTTKDENTGEQHQSISLDVPGLTAKDVKVKWNKETRTLTLTGNSGDPSNKRSYSYTISTFSEDLLEDTLSVKVENGIATITGKLKDIVKKEKEEEKEVELDIPVK